MTNQKTEFQQHLDLISRSASTAPTEDRISIRGAVAKLRKDHDDLIVEVTAIYLCLMSQRYEHALDLVTKIRDRIDPQ